MPHHNLELFSNAPVTSLDHYRALGRNAVGYAKRESVEPILVPNPGLALGAPFYARVALIFAIETDLTDPEAEPEALDLQWRKAGA